MLAVIHFLPGLFYVGAIVGGAVAGWLSGRDEKEKKKPHDPLIEKSEEEEAKSELTSAIDALDNLYVKTEDDDYAGDDRFKLLDL